MKNVISLFLFLSFLFSPLFSIFAQSTTTVATTPASASSGTADLLAEIQKLLTLITSLQTQLDTLKAEQTKVSQELGASSTTTATPPSASQATESVAPFSPTPLPTVTFTRTLGRGLIGNDVRELQLFLKSLPGMYPEGLLTNFYGPLTEKAVQRFQAEYGIVDSGTAATTGFGAVGSKTQQKIRELIAQGAGNSGNIPPGLLTAPGIQKKLAPEAPTTPTITPSGTIPAQQSTSFAPASITIISPNGGEQWIKGNSHQITWHNPVMGGFPGDRNFSWKVIVEASDGKFWSVGNFPVSATEATWIVPLSLPDIGTAYKARVTLERACTSTPCPSHTDVLHNTPLEDTSDNTFSIYALAVAPVPPPPVPTPTPSTVPSTGTVASATTQTATTTTTLPPPPSPTPVPSPTPPPSSTTSTTTATDTIAPSVPVTLALSISSSQIYLSWSGSTDNVGVVGYKIYRCVCNNTANMVYFASVTAGAIYADTGLTPLTSYTYTIAAYDAAGNVSAQSSSASGTTYIATTQDTTAPSVPTNLSAVYVPPSQIFPGSTTEKFKLSWSASTDASGVTGYKVYRDGVFLMNFSTTTMGTVSYEITVSTGSSYNFTVAAFDNAQNVSAQSNSVSATTFSAATISQVQGLIATVSGTSVALSWQAGTASAGIGVYNIYRGTSADFTPSLTYPTDNHIAQGNVLSYTDSNLSAGTYYYKVALQDVNGIVGPASSAVSATISPATACTGTVLLDKTSYVIGEWYTITFNGCSSWNLPGTTGTQKYATLLKPDNTKRFLSTFGRADGQIIDDFPTSSGYVAGAYTVLVCELYYSYDDPSCSIGGARLLASAQFTLSNANLTSSTTAMHMPTSGSNNLTSLAQILASLAAMVEQLAALIAVLH